MLFRSRKDDVQVLIGEFLRQENKENVKFDPMVIAIGLLIFVSMSNVFLNLKVTLDQYYAECKFADVFARVYSFPVDKLKNLGKIPGITAVSGRLTGDIRLQMENNANSDCSFAAAGASPTV